MTEQETRTVVERYLREVLTGTGPARDEELIASPLLRQKVSAFRLAFADISVKPHLMLVDGDYVAVHLSARGRHRGIFQGVPPTGRSWSASCSALYRVQDGRIADFWLNWDLLAILEQLGGVRRSSTASA